MSEMVDILNYKPEGYSVARFHKCSLRDTPELPRIREISLT